MFSFYEFIFLQLLYFKCITLNSQGIINKLKKFHGIIGNFHSKRTRIIYELMSIKSQTDDKNLSISAIVFEIKDFAPNMYRKEACL